MKKSPLPLQTSGGTDRTKQSQGKDALVKLLRWHFGHAEYRGKQLEAIEAVLSGTVVFSISSSLWKRLFLSDANRRREVDVLSDPSIGQNRDCACCLSIDRKNPLMHLAGGLRLFAALMENQVMALKEKGISAEFLSSAQTSQAKNKIHADLDSGKPSLRMLYVTPELIATAGFMSKLKKIFSRGLLNLIAIDEAHCISSWGHDFRPSYRKLSSLRNQLPGVPILALTATAVPKVQSDVMNSLSMYNPLVLRSSFNRPNIYYEVRYKDLLNDVYADLCNVLKTSGNVCGIVYCLERTACDDLSSYLSRNGISCAAYHAGLNDKLRSSVLDDWISSKIQVVVATVAFGMGIDRKDVRIVCHYNIPKSMEGFYQESGRAGRDQLPSRSLLYYGVDDRKRMEFIIRNAKNKKSQSQQSNSEQELSKKSLADFSMMVEYSEGSGCRRKKILESFGEQVTASLCNKSCDACKHPNMVSKYLEELRSACTLRQRYGSSQIVMGSSSGRANEDRVSEFWNREDEASCSEEDVSDSDDDNDIVRSLYKSGGRAKPGLMEKMEFLQRAEENYYHSKSEKQVNKPDKNAISEAFREASKQRLLNALTQAQQRLNCFKMEEIETSASFLENQCFTRYGKSGKSFYYSQVASTVRWLSTADSTELTSRIGLNNQPPGDNNLKHKQLLQDNQERSEFKDDQVDNGVFTIMTSPVSSLQSQASSPILPAIPSFSDFMSRKKTASSREDGKIVEKKMRLQ